MVLKPIVTWLRAPAASGPACRFEEAIAAYQKWIQRTAWTKRVRAKRVRARLGDEQLERADARDMELSLDEALDLALRKAGSA
jgi:hypothetical protein